MGYHVDRMGIYIYIIQRQGWFNQPMMDIHGIWGETHWMCSLVQLNLLRIKWWYSDTNSQSSLFFCRVLYLGLAPWNIKQVEFLPKNMEHDKENMYRLFPTIPPSNRYWTGCIGFVQSCFSGGCFWWVGRDVRWYLLYHGKPFEAPKKNPSHFGLDKMHHRFLS